MNEEFFELLINNNRDGIFAFDLECRYTVWNPAMQRFFGVNKTEVLGKSAVEILPFLKQSGEDEFYDKALTGETVTAEYRPYILLQTGQTGFYEVSYAPLYNKTGEIIGGLGTVRDVTKHHQAETAEREQRRWLETMRQVTQDLTVLRDLDTLLSQIVDRALQLFGADGGGIYLYRAERQLLEWSVAVGDLEEPIGLTLRLGEGLSGKVWATGQPFIVDDYQTWPGKSPQWSNAPVSAIGVPIQWGDEFMGVLALRVLNTLRQFSLDDLPLISQFSAQAAIAIKNAQLFEGVKQHISQLDALRQASLSLTSSLDLQAVLEAILQSTLQLLDDAHDAQIFVCQDERLIFSAALWADGPRGQAVATPRLHGLTYTVVQEGRLMAVADMQTHPMYADAPPEWKGAIAALPLKIGQQVVGVMNVAYNYAREWPETELHMLQLLADQAAIAIKNARLYGETQSSLAQITRLYEFSAEFVSTLSLGEVADLVIKKVVQATEAHSAVLNLTDDQGNLQIAVSPHDEAPPQSVKMVMRTFETGQPFIVSDTEQQPELLPAYLLQMGIRAAIGLPLRAVEQTIGLLFVRYDQPHHFSQREIEMLFTFANQAAIAIHNARLYEQARQEIAERERVEKALRQSEAKNRAILSGIPDLLLRIHRDGTYLELIPGIEIEPYQPYDQILGKNMYDILPETVARKHIYYVAQALHTGQVEVYETQLMVAGKLTDFEARTVASGEDEALIMIRDISQRKRTEEAIAKERNLLRTLIDNLPHYIYFKDVAHRFVIGNEAVAQIMGAGSPDEIVGKSDFDFYPRELAERYQVDEQRVMQSGQPVIDLEEPLVDPAGNQRWILTSQVPLHDSQGQIIGLVGVGRDITERKKVEAELQAYREGLEALVKERTAELEQAMTEIAAARDRINAILHSVADGLLVTDVNHRIILANAAAANLLELPLDQILDRKIEDGLKNDRLQESVQQTLNHQHDGAEIDIQLEDSNRQRSRVVRARTALVADQHGQPLGTVTIIQDVTRLREVDRLKTELLTTVAHELRTPLTSILGFSEILLNRQLDVTRQHRYLKFINQQSTHLAEIIQDLLDVSRLESGRGLDLKLDMIDMANLIEEIIAPFTDTATTHKIQTEGFSGLPLLLGDRFRLVQVGRNLLSNAIKYSAPGDKIIIRGRWHADYLEISFQDEGIGMSPEQQKYLFEPFYRADASHTAVGGTGLGLAISRLIIEQHGGQIWLQSELGKGTTVYFKLPLPQNRNEV